MNARKALILAAVGIGAYMLYRSMRGRRTEDKRLSGGYCLGGVWIPPGAGEPYVRDGAMFYCPNPGNGGCLGEEVRVDLENVDKRCI